MYTYDSMVAEGGLGEVLFPLFEKKCGCKVRALASGDAGQLLARLQIDAERGKPKAHVVLGIDQHLWPRARNWLESWKDWKPKGYDGLPADLKVGEGFLPFDYGVFAFMMDTRRLQALKAKPPKSLKALLSPTFKRNIILQDPRTSTPGMAFLLYTSEVLGDEAWSFWERMRGQWLTLAPGWDSAYGLFLKGEAPLVWSYTTSQAYHREKGDVKGRYQALLFDEGHPVQIEGAALVKGSLRTAEERKRAREFLEFLLSSEVQDAIPKRNWMLPVVKSARLPESFKNLPEPEKLHRIESSEKETARRLQRWSQVVEGGR